MSGTFGIIRAAFLTDLFLSSQDYAFVHFEERESAVAAMNSLNGTDVGGSCIEISLAKPPSDKKKKEEMLRARERRMMQMITQRPP